MCCRVSFRWCAVVSCVLKQRTVLLRLLLVWCCGFGAVLSSAAAHGESLAGALWERLLSDAEELHLPTAFLKTIPSDFIRFEFDDLRTYAAEYHLGEHRLVLNRSLSFNAAGRVLKPLTKMTHKELEVLYHELFHAYMDYLHSIGDQGVALGQASNGLLGFAKQLQACRYAEVAITPLVYRRQETESRYLTESESWEALNETWAVFVGWAIWNQLEVERKRGGSVREQSHVDEWAQRLGTAFLNGDFRGYYVPQDADERRITQKRFLAKSSQLSWGEATALMAQVLEFSDKYVDRVAKTPELSGIINEPSPC